MRALPKLPKDWKKLLKPAIDQGAVIKPKKSGVLVIGPLGSVTIHTSPSPKLRSLQNATAALRQAGFDL